MSFSAAAAAAAYEFLVLLLTAVQARLHLMYNAAARSLLKTGYYTCVTTAALGAVARNKQLQQLHAFLLHASDTPCMQQRLLIYQNVSNPHQDILTRQGNQIH